MINFGVGQPSEDLLPVDLVRTASADFLAVAHPLELNYGERQGDEGFRRSLAGLLTREYESDVTADSLFVTAGNSQALDFVCGEFAHWGDTVFVEEPSYFLAHQIFRDHGLNPIGIPVDSDGLVIEALHEALTRHRPTLVYTIPSFHNPGGQSLSVERRKELARLSLEHDFVVVADEVYQLLHYFGKPPAAMGTMADQGNILSLGSFSKIMAPGLRLGWIQTSPRWMEKLLNTNPFSGGCAKSTASGLKGWTRRCGNTSVNSPRGAGPAAGISSGWSSIRRWIHRHCATKQRTSIRVFSREKSFPATAA
jgi:DNA-binding transcriptional MocR family regulator